MRLIGLPQAIDTPVQTVAVTVDVAERDVELRELVDFVLLKEEDVRELVDRVFDAELVLFVCWNEKLPIRRISPPHETQ